MDGEPLATCVENYMNLPSTQGDPAHFDGNSQGCRMVHVVLAGFSPSQHCPHVALTPTPDMTGSIKCQESKDEQPSSLFNAQDLELLERFQLAVGVDPETGFHVRNATEELVIANDTASVNQTSDDDMEEDVDCWLWCWIQSVFSLDGDDGESDGFLR